MEMSPDLRKIHELLMACEKEYESEHGKRPKGGARNTFSHASFILFFISMFLRKIFAFQGMEKAAKERYEQFGFPNAPSRKTIRRRLLQMPKVLTFFLPWIARYCFKRLSSNAFNLRWLFTDKSVFRSNGGVWHKKQMELGVVPHPSIDTEASWAKSAYHGWRFGYGLMILTNESRFPVNACADTASFCEHRNLEKLLVFLQEYIGMVIGDAAYHAIETILKLFDTYGIFLLTKLEATANQVFHAWYRSFTHTIQAVLLYKRRKSSVEPCFSLIKELFALKGESQLPYKGKARAESFLLVTVVAIQLLMYHNFVTGNHFRELGAFSSLLR